MIVKMEQLKPLFYYYRYGIFIIIIIIIIIIIVLPSFRPLVFCEYLFVIDVIYIYIYIYIHIYIYIYINILTSNCRPKQYQKTAAMLVFLNSERKFCSW